MGFICLNNFLKAKRAILLARSFEAVWEFVVMKTAWWRCGSVLECAGRSGGAVGWLIIYTHDSLVGSKF
jgi:hypothetical protein